jgi:hypothetical protein
MEAANPTSPRLLGLPDLVKQRAFQGGPTKATTGLAFSRDGGLFSAAREGDFRLWDRRTGKQARRVVAYPNGLSAIAISPDGKMIATGRTAPYFTLPIIRLWETDTLRLRAQLATNLPYVNRLAFSPDGKQLVAVGGVLFSTAGRGVEAWSLYAPDQKKPILLGPRLADEVCWLWSLLSQAGLDDFPLLSLIAQFAPGEWAGSPGGFEAQWRALASKNGEDAYEAMVEMLTEPARSVRLLRQRLMPPTGSPTTRARIAKLLPRLDSDSYDERHRAEQKLRGLGWRAETQLCRLHHTSPSLDLVRRAEKLLYALDGTSTEGRARRVRRAIEVLERIGTKESRRLLLDLARREPGLRLANEARAAWAR